MYYNLLPKIKNAIRARKDSVMTPFSKMDLAVAQALVAAGYLKSAEKRMIGKKQCLEVKILFKNKEAAMTDFKLVSKPSRRIYAGYKELKPVKQGHGISMLSTPQGILTNRGARKEKVGGEYLFDIW